MQQPRPPEDPDEDRERSRNNLLFLVVAVLLVIAGIWLVNKLNDLRNLQNCLESGRRNCAPIETPPPRRAPSGWDVHEEAGERPSSARTAFAIGRGRAAVCSLSPPGRGGSSLDRLNSQLTPLLLDSSQSRRRNFCARRPKPTSAV